LLRLGRALVEQYCGSFRVVPKRIVLDIDDTPLLRAGRLFDRVHGGQQLRLFNARRAGRKVWQLANVREGSPAAPGRARWTLTSSVDRPCNCTKINSNLSHVTAYKTILMEGVSALDRLMMS